MFEWYPSETTFGNNYSFLQFHLIATIIITIVLLIHEIVQMMRQNVPNVLTKVFTHIRRYDNFVQIVSLIFTAIYVGAVFTHFFTDIKVKEDRLMTMKNDVKENIELINMTKIELNKTLNHLNIGKNIVFQSQQTKDELFEKQFNTAIQLLNETITEFTKAQEMHEHFLDLLDKIHDNVDSIKEIYSGEFGDVWPLSKMIEKLNNLETQVQSLTNYLMLQNKENGEIDIQIKKATFHLTRSKLICEKTKSIKGEKSFLIKGNMILDIRQNIFGLLPSYGFFCILLASLCPIFLAFKIKKLAIHARIMYKVLKKMLTLFLIYANIITLFKNLLVYLLYDNNNQFLQKNKAVITPYSKTFGKSNNKLILYIFQLH